MFDGFGKFLKMDATRKAVGYYSITVILLSIGLLAAYYASLAPVYTNYLILYAIFSAYVAKSAISGEILTGRKIWLYYIAFMLAVISPVLWVILAFSWMQSGREKTETYSKIDKEADTALFVGAILVLAGIFMFRLGLLFGALLILSGLDLK
ncbi:MAG: hypothetical protein ABH829_02445, partial [archaeon]